MKVKGNMESVNKKDLAMRIAASNGDISEKVAYAVINAFIEEVQAAVVAGERVALSGFGSFEARHRNARRGRNPRTGADVPVPARTVAVFNTAKGFNDRVGAAKDAA